MGCLKAVMSLKVQRNRTTFSCSFRMGAIFTKNQTGVPESAQRHALSCSGHGYARSLRSQPDQLAHFWNGSWLPDYICMEIRTLCSFAELKLTVFLVHQYLKRVHLIILKRQSHFFRGVLVCQLAVHEAAKQTGEITTLIFNGQRRLGQVRSFGR